MLRGDLDAGHDFERRAGRGVPGCGDAAERVVVGDGDGGQAGAAGEIDDLGRRVGAVAVGGVDVQVGPAGGGAASGELTEGGERLACGHVSRGWGRGSGEAGRGRR